MFWTYVELAIIFTFLIISFIYSYFISYSHIFGNCYQKISQKKVFATLFMSPNNILKGKNTRVTTIDLVWNVSCRYTYPKFNCNLASESTSTKTREYGLRYYGVRISALGISDIYVTSRFVCRHCQYWNYHHSCNTNARRYNMDVATLELRMYKTHASKIAYTREWEREREREREREWVVYQFSYSDSIRSPAKIHRE